MTEHDERDEEHAGATGGTDPYDDATDPLTHRLPEADTATEVTRRHDGWALGADDASGPEAPRMGRHDQAGGQAGLTSADPPDEALRVDRAEQDVVDPGGDPRSV